MLRHQVRSGESGGAGENAAKHSDDVAERPVVVIVERMDLAVAVPPHVRLDAIHDALLELGGIAGVARDSARGFRNGAVDAPPIGVRTVDLRMVRVAVGECTGELAPCIRRLQDVDDIP